MRVIGKRGEAIIALCSAFCVTSACASGVATRSTHEVAPAPLEASIQPKPPSEGAATITARTSIAQAAQLAIEASSRGAREQASSEARVALTSSLEATRERLGLRRHDVQSTPDYAQILKAWRAPSAPFSAGTTSRGHLLGAETLEIDGEHHEIIARARGRNTRYGHPTMIQALKHAAAYVAERHPGSKLAVGNIAYERGGDIRWSVSHNSGRDADLAFYVIDAITAERVEVAPDLITFDDAGRSLDHQGYLFDVERNWALVKGLLDDNASQIQYLFVSEGLKALLIEHAMRQDEPEAILLQAADVLRQPTESLPHNDHFHLRLACDLNDRLRGCVDSGPRYAWGRWHEDELAAYTQAMAEALNDPKTSVRLEALEYVAAIDSPVGAEFALALGARNDRAEVRQRAITIGASFWTLSGLAVWSAQQLITEAETTIQEKRTLYALLRRSRDLWAMEFALERLSDPSLALEEHALAARAMAHHMEHDLVPELLKQLGAHRDGAVREQLALVLRRVANRSEGIDWARANEEEIERALNRWEAWWETHRESSREAWLKSGLAEATGLDEREALSVQAIEPMIEALKGSPDHLRYNLNRSLREITGKWSSLEQRDADKLYAMWSAWWRRHGAERFTGRAS